MSERPLVTEGALEYATRRVEDFARVQNSRQWNERVEAAGLFLDALGLEESLKVAFTEWAERFCGPGWDGALFIGLAVGLFINEYNNG